MSLEPTNAEIEEVVDAAIADHPDKAGQILNVLRDVQKRFRYVPIGAIDAVGRRLDVPFGQMVELVSAFSELSFEPVGKHLIVVCDGTACHAAGAVNIVSALEDELGIACGQTTEDGEFTLRTAYCVGSCGQAPIAIVDSRNFGKVHLSEAAKIPQVVCRTSEQRNSERSGEHR